MDYNHQKADDAALALLYLNMFSDHGMTRAWRGVPWEILDRLFEKGLIADPKSKAKSVYLSEEGERKCEALFNQLFVE